MSVILVENAAIRRAVYALALAGDYVHARNTKSQDELAALGQEIYELNNKAYNAHHGTRRRVPHYEHGPADPTTPVVQLYKSLVYVLFQCDEPKTRAIYLFRELQRARAQVALWIVENSREYENCGWE